MRSILKTEYIYRQKLKTFQQANELIDEYSHFYNHERLQSLIFSFYPLQISFLYCLHNRGRFSSRRLLLMVAQNGIVLQRLGRSVGGAVAVPVLRDGVQRLDAADELVLVVPDRKSVV